MVKVFYNKLVLETYNEDPLMVSMVADNKVLSVNQLKVKVTDYISHLFTCLALAKSGLVMGLLCLSV